MIRLKIILLSLMLGGITLSCMETDAKVLQLEREKADLQQEIMILVDSLEILHNNMQLEIINLNAEIQAKDNSFDSLMVLWNECLSDTVYLNTLKQRLRELL